VDHKRLPHGFVEGATAGGAGTDSPPSARSGNEKAPNSIWPVDRLRSRLASASRAGEPTLRKYASPEHQNSVHRNMEGDSRLCSRSIPMSSGCNFLLSAQPSPPSPRQATKLGALEGETKYNEMEWMIMIILRSDCSRVWQGNSDSRRCGSIEMICGVVAFEMLCAPAPGG
jgi:hypothetical protein